MKVAMPLVCIAALLASLSGVALASSTEAEVTPVQKVIELLNNMLVKGKKEKHSEQVQYAAYKQFCDDTTVEKKRAIEEAAEKIDMLKADIEKLTNDAAVLAKEIAEHDEDISVWTGDQKAATNVRELEKTDYEALHKDYSESVDALERAIAVLKKQAHDRKQASSLAQVANLQGLSLIPPQAKKAIETFLQQGGEDFDSDDGLAVSAPEAAGYEFQSSGIIDMLEKLLDKFIDERTAIEKEEMNTQHAYEMLMQDLSAQLEQAKKDREEKAVTKAKKLQKKADAEGELKDTITTMEEDKKYLSELEATCSQKATDFESRQQLRTEEIEAIQKAIEIISDEKVTGASEKYLPSVLQISKGPISVSLLEVRSIATSPQQMQVAQFLQHRAAELNSRVLASIATHAADDPFTKVKKMIKDLIVRLMEEANEEAEHKGWCDTELSTNEQTRKEKTAAVETLHSEIDELEASIAKLTEEVAELTTEVAELDAAMAKATKLRQDEKEENTVTIKDAAAAQTAVAQAITVLKEFYAKAGDSTALLQAKRQEPPPVFSEPYKGMNAEGGGVVGMLEVIESDFARLEAETKAAEATAQKEYDEFMTESKVAKAAKSTDIEHKSAKKQDQEQALVMKKEDLEGTQKELDAALAYFDKLKPSCVDSGVSYDDRVSRRKEEIESLQEALKILNGEDIAR